MKENRNRMDRMMAEMKAYEQRMREKREKDREQNGEIDFDISGEEDEPSGCGSAVIRILKYLEKLETLRKEIISLEKEAIFTILPECLKKELNDFRHDKDVDEDGGMDEDVQAYGFEFLFGSMEADNTEYPFDDAGSGIEESGTYSGSIGSVCWKDPANADGLYQYPETGSEEESRVCDHGSTVMVVYPEEGSILMTMEELSKKLGELFGNQIGSYDMHPVPGTGNLYYTTGDTNPYVCNGKACFRYPVVVFAIDWEAGKTVNPGLKELFTAIRYFRRASVNYMTPEGEKPAFCFD